MIAAYTPKVLSSTAHDGPACFGPWDPHGVYLPRGLGSVAAGARVCCLCLCRESIAELRGDEGVKGAKEQLTQGSGGK